MNNNRVSEFSKYVEEVMNAYDARGLCCAVVNKNGSVLYENFFGSKNHNRDIIDGETLFGLASVTKSFTAAAIMQLVEKGLLSLDDPVSLHVPGLDIKNPTVKIWHLLSHCAGFFPFKRILIQDVAAEMGITDEDGELCYNVPLSERGAQMVVDRMNEETDFLGSPGRYLSYSNDGYALLSDIIRRYGGEDTYAAYIDKHISAPLAMNRSSCRFIEPRDGKNTSLLYYMHKDEMIVTDDFYNNSFVLMGGGSMKSTLNDMKKYAHMYLSGGGGVLSPDSVAEMIRPRIYYKPQSYYCLGLSTKFLDDLTIVQHGGSLTGVSSNFAFSPEIGAAVIVLCNTTGVAVELVSDAAFRLVNGKKIRPADAPPTEMPWCDTLLQKAAGRYVSREGESLELSVDNGKLSAATDGKPREIIPTHPGAALMKSKLEYRNVSLMISQDNQVWGARMGGRVLPRV